MIIRTFEWYAANAWVTHVRRVGVPSRRQQVTGCCTARQGLHSMGLSPAARSSLQLPLPLCPEAPRSRYGQWESSPLDVERSGARQGRVVEPFELLTRFPPTVICIPSPITPGRRTQFFPGVVRRRVSSVSVGQMETRTLRAGAGPVAGEAPLSGRAQRVNVPVRPPVASGSRAGRQVREARHTPHRDGCGGWLRCASPFSRPTPIMSGGV